MLIHTDDIIAAMERAVGKPCTSDGPGMVTAIDNHGRLIEVSGADDGHSGWEDIGTPGGSVEVSGLSVLVYPSVDEDFDTCIIDLPPSVEALETVLTMAGKQPLEWVQQYCISQYGTPGR